MKLRAVNGSKIECFGHKEVMIKIGRKEYKFKAIKANVKTPVLGWDFMRKHKLNLIWNDFGDITIYDAKAQISKSLQFKSLPVEQSLASKKLARIDASPRGAVGHQADQLVAQVAAMRALPVKEPAPVKVPPQYQALQVLEGVASLGLKLRRRWRIRRCRHRRKLPL